MKYTDKDIKNFFKRTEPSVLTRVKAKGYFKEDEDNVEFEDDFDDDGSGVTESEPWEGGDFPREDVIYDKLIEFGLSEDQADEIITMILDSEVDADMTAGDSEFPDDFEDDDGSGVTESEPWESKDKAAYIRRTRGV